MSSAPGSFRRFFSRPDEQADETSSDYEPFPVAGEDSEREIERSMAFSIEDVRDDIEGEVDADPSDLELIDAHDVDMGLSDDAKHRRRMLAQMRDDVRAFDEELVRNEIFAVKTREHLKKFREFFQEAESEVEDVAALGREIALKDETIARMSRRTMELEAGLRDQKTLLQAEQNRLAEVRDVVETIRSENSELSERSETLKNEVRSLSRARDVAETRNTQLNTKVADLAAELRVVGDTKERLERDSTQNFNLIAELEARVEELDNTQARLTSQRDKLFNDVSDRSKAFSDVQAELLEFRSRYKSEKSEAESQDRYLRSLLRARDEEVTALKSEIETLHSQLTVRTKMFNQAQNDMNSAKAVAKVSRDTAGEVEARLIESNLLRESEQKQLLETNREVAELNTRVYNLVQELEDVRRENHDLRKVQKLYDDRLREVTEFDVKVEETVTSRATAAKIGPPKRKLQ